MFIINQLGKFGYGNKSIIRCELLFVTIRLGAKDLTQLEPAQHFRRRVRRVMVIQKAFNQMER